MRSLMFIRVVLPLVNSIPQVMLLIKSSASSQTLHWYALPLFPHHHMASYPPSGWSIIRDLEEVSSLQHFDITSPCNPRLLDPPKPHPDLKDP